MVRWSRRPVRVICADYRFPELRVLRRFRVICADYGNLLPYQDWSGRSPKGAESSNRPGWLTMLGNFR